MTKISGAAGATAIASSARQIRNKKAAHLAPLFE
jgi:hypothetical protein